MDSVLCFKLPAEDVRLIQYSDTIYKVRLKYESENTFLPCSQNQLDKQVKEILRDVLLAGKFSSLNLATEHFDVRCTTTPWELLQLVQFTREWDNEILNAFPSEINIKFQPKGLQNSSKEEVPSVSKGNQCIDVHSKQYCKPCMSRGLLIPLGLSKENCDENNNGEVSNENTQNVSPNQPNPSSQANNPQQSPSFSVYSGRSEGSPEIPPIGRKMPQNQNNTLINDLTSASQKLTYPSQDTTSPAKGRTSSTQNLTSPSQTLISPSQNLISPSQNLISPSQSSVREYIVVNPQEQVNLNTSYVASVERRVYLGFVEDPNETLNTSLVLKETIDESTRKKHKSPVDASELAQQTPPKQSRMEQGERRSSRGMGDHSFHTGGSGHTRHYPRSSREHLDIHEGSHTSAESGDSRRKLRYSGTPTFVGMSGDGPRKPQLATLPPTYRQKSSSHLRHSPPRSGRTPKSSKFLNASYGGRKKRLSQTISNSISSYSSGRASLSEGESDWDGSTKGNGCGSEQSSSSYEQMDHKKQSVLGRGCRRKSPKRLKPRSSTFGRALDVFLDSFL